MVIDFEECQFPKRYIVEKRNRQAENGTNLYGIPCEKHGNTRKTRLGGNRK